MLIFVRALINEGYLMEQQQTPPQRNKASVWIQAARPFSFTASMTPIIVGAMLALDYQGPVSWFLFPLIAVCSLLLHAGANIVSDYFDYLHGVDQADTYGGSRVLLQGLLEPKLLLRGGMIVLAAAFVLGMILVVLRGMPVFWFGIVGLLGGYFYTGKPIAYKYYALGDFLVFTLFGPLMVIGSYFVLTNDFNTNVLYVSLPIGFLVASILHANNTRDISFDRRAKAYTVANVLGLRAAIAEYYLLVLGAYASVIIMVLLGVVKPWTLVVFLGMFPALKNLKTIRGAQVENPSAIAMLDVQSAQHHMLFGILLSVGLILSAVL